MEKWVTLGITGQTWENGSFFSKMGETWRNGSHLDYYVASEKKNGSHLKKCVTLVKKGQNCENGSHLEYLVKRGKNWSDLEY